jgi:hypothetical protein
MGRAHLTTERGVSASRGLGWRTCLRKGCGQRFQARRYNQRYCQDPQCLREVRRWQEAKRQRKCRSQPERRQRHAEAERQRRKQRALQPSCATCRWSWRPARSSRSWARMAPERPRCSAAWQASPGWTRAKSTTTASCSAAIASTSAAASPSCPKWLPIGDGEVCRLWWKIPLLATLSVAPLFLILGAVAGWRVYGQPLCGLLVAAIWIYTGLAVFTVRLAFVPGSKHTSEEVTYLLRRIPLLFLLMCVVIGLAAAICCALQWTYPILTAVGVAALPLLSLALWHINRRSLDDRWRGDWLPPR